MTNNDEDDMNDWHRQHAARSNNRAWALSTTNRSETEDREMLNAAHASAYHWSVVGTELHNMRATMLLAEVHSALGMAESAVGYANDMWAYFTNQSAVPDWELAFAHTIYAHAALVAGNKDLYKSSYEQAQQSIANIADDEDRTIVLETFDLLPNP